MMRGHTSFMKKPRSSALASYLDEVSRYLVKVKTEARLTNEKIGAIVNKTQGSISKAINKIHELDYRSVLVVSEHTGIPIPPSLKEASLDRSRGLDSNASLTERARALADQVQVAPPEVLEQIAKLLEKKRG